jgi:hypothetical protein
MTAYHFIAFSLLVACPLFSRAQENPVIPVSKYKTTFIILYNTKPERANIGGEDGAILYAEMETSKDTVKIIKLQAAKENFTTTNLLISCADTIMEFTLVYVKDPPITRYPFRYSGNRVMNTTNFAPGAGKMPAGPNMATETDSITQNGITVSTKSLLRLQAEKRIIRRSKKEQGLILFLDNVGLDSADQHHFFKLRVKNTTGVSYTIDYIKFIVESLEESGIGSRASSAAADDYPPYFSAPFNKITIKAGEQQELIYAVKKLPLTTKEKGQKGEQLAIIMKEQADNSRGRTLTLKAQAVVILNKENISRL